MRRRIALRNTLLALTAMLPATAPAATTQRLPAYVCDAPFALFVDGLEGDGAVVRDASNGTGGATPGAQSRVVAVPGFGNRAYYLHIPTRLDAAKPAPLLLVLHGAAGNPAAADGQAQQTRALWGTIAEGGGFIVAAPVASGNAGGWLAPPPGPSDYDVFATIVADVEAHYNVDRTRRYAWGFSAGGHVLHDLMFGPYFPALDADEFAGYAVAAGALAALACNGLSDAACSALLDDATRPIPLWLQVGVSDPLRPYVLADRNRFLTHGWSTDDTLHYFEFGGGHTYTAAHLGRTWDFLCPFQRLP